MSNQQFKDLISEAVKDRVSKDKPGESKSIEGRQAESKPVEEVLLKIIKLIMRDEQCNYRKCFLLEGINSTQMVKLLFFLEHENQTIRKLALFFFSLVVANPKSKVYFLEKCGFGLSYGKVLFTRLKYLQNALQKHPDSTGLVRSCLGSILNSKSIGKDALFWYVPISNIEELNVKLKVFYESDIERQITEGWIVETMPDSIDSLCGFEFWEYDKPELDVRQSLVMYKARQDKMPSRDELSTKGEKSGRRNLMIEKSTDFSERKSRKNEQTSPVNRSISKTPKNGTPDILNKYRSSIKDRTPSLNIKKENKASSIVGSRRSDNSPLRTPKNTDSRTDNKNIKSQKINDLISKVRASRSPTDRDSRTNVSERVSKVNFGSRK